MIAASLDRLRALEDVDLHDGIDDARLKRFGEELGFDLSKEHIQVLKFSNGIDVYAGYIRLFGIYNDSPCDSMLWNRNDYWKFAWEDRCTEFWCFAETSWGDQYAYSIRSLRDHGDSEIFFLDAISMTAKVVFPSFRDFFEKEFLRQATEPYDQTIIRARQKFGRLKPDLHLVSVPSILLGGSEDIKNIELQNSRSAMVCNGDIAVQIDRASAKSSVIAIKPYQDEYNRMRLHLVLAEPAKL